jgi:hypothetical protein
MVDVKERKRKRDRERYAAMSVEQKNKKNRKHCETRQRSKDVMPNVSGGDEKCPILINKSAHKPTIGK